MLYAIKLLLCATTLSSVGELQATAAHGTRQARVAHFEVRPVDCLSCATPGHECRSYVETRTNKFCLGETSLMRGAALSDRKIWDAGGEILPLDSPDAPRDDPLMPTRARANEM